MSESCRLRYFVAGSGGEGQVDGLLLRDAVADTYVDGLYVGSSADDRADRLFFVNQIHEITFLGPEWGVFADESGFGHAETGPAEPDAEVACQAETARVREALGVGHKNIGYGVQLGEGREDGRHFSETEESRDVGKRDIPLVRDLFDQGKLGVRDDRYGRLIPVSPDANINASDMPHWMF